jgi:hypothetical protein
MTAVLHEDLVVTSPSGRVVLEARSPDNDPDRPRARDALPAAHPRRIWNGFQSDFVYTVRRADDGVVLWTRAQPRDEAGPVGACVDEQGRAVVWTRTNASSEVMVFAADGALVRALDVHALLPREELWRTTAGPQWDLDGHAYTVDLAGRPHWCMHTQSGRRMLLELETGTHVEDVTPFVADLERAERTWALRTLWAGVSAAAGWPLEMHSERDFRAIRPVLLAARLAGALALREAVPLLQRLEGVALESMTSFWSVAPSPRAPRGSVTVTHLRLRRLAQWSLRKLDVEPAMLPAYLFHAGTIRDPLPVRVAPRGPLDAARASAGGDFWETVAALGAPDALERRAWRYHLGLADGATLELRWDAATHRVSEARWRRPPTWVEERAPTYFG